MLDDASVSVTSKREKSPVDRCGEAWRSALSPTQRGVHGWLELASHLHPTSVSKTPNSWESFIGSHQTTSQDVLVLVLVNASQSDDAGSFLPSSHLMVESLGKPCATSPVPSGQVCAVLLSTARAVP